MYIGGRRVDESRCSGRDDGAEAVTCTWAVTCVVRGGARGDGGSENHDLWARAIHAVRVCRPVAMGTAQRTSAQVAYSQSKLGRTEQRAPDMGHGPGAENGTRKRASPRASADGRDRESEERA